MGRSGSVLTRLMPHQTPVENIFPSEPDWALIRNSYRVRRIAAERAGALDDSARFVYYASK